MLRHLRVTNFAILSDVALDLGPGFNVLTGETGAGKSLIVEAVNLLRGGRASADIPRAGTDQATVEAIFEVPTDLVSAIRSNLEQAGVPVEGDGSELLVRRVIHRGGRSRTYINGALTTAARLADLGRMLVDLSGQHQHQGLTDAKRHRDILDEFGGHRALTLTMAERYQTLSDLRDQLSELSADESAREQRLDFLRFQLEELEAASLRPGEATELGAERDRLRASDRLQAAASSAERCLYSGDTSAVDLIDSASRELHAVVEHDAELSAPLKAIDEARTLIEDAARELSAYLQNLEADPRRLAELEERLALIRRLERKHGGDLDSVIARVDELRAELDRLENRDQRLAELEAEVARAEEIATEAATELTRARKRAARKLTTQVERGLAGLEMGAAELSARLESRELGPHGSDHIEMLLASNKGEEPKPLARIASGGELSRIMLALKLVLRQADGVATYVFDEVDAGIGGATAEVVGERIRELANCRQVLCVTHLPQIAAYGDHHYHVSKAEVEGRTETSVDTLTGAARRDEIARMLAGSRVTPKARAHAKEMLSRARPAS